MGTDTCPNTKQTAQPNPKQTAQKQQQAPRKKAVWPDRFGEKMGRVRTRRSANQAESGGGRILRLCRSIQGPVYCFCVVLGLGVMAGSGSQTHSLYLDSRQSSRRPAAPLARAPEPYRYVPPLHVLMDRTTSQPPLIQPIYRINHLRFDTDRHAPLFWWHLLQDSSRLNSSNSISPDPSVSILLISSSMSIVRPKSCLMICVVGMWRTWLISKESVRPPRQAPRTDFDERLPPDVARHVGAAAAGHECVDHVALVVKPFGAGLLGLNDPQEVVEVDRPAHGRVDLCVCVCVWRGECADAGG